MKFGACFFFIILFLLFKGKNLINSFLQKLTPKYLLNITKIPIMAMIIIETITPEILYPVLDSAF